MKLTKRLLKEQIKKTLREASTFEKFYNDDDELSYTDTDALDHQDQKQLAADEEEISKC